MSVVNKKNDLRKISRVTGAKTLKNKTIGLDEKIEEAKRVLKSLKNPELLK